MINIADVFYGPWAIATFIGTPIIVALVVLWWNRIEHYPVRRRTRQAAVGAGVSLAALSVILIAIPVWDVAAARPPADRIGTTTFETQEGKIDVVAGLFTSGFKFKAVGSHGVETLYCDGKDTTFDETTSATPTVALTFAKRKDTDPPFMSATTFEKTCVVTGAGDFLADFWVEQRSAED